MLVSNSPWLATAIGGLLLTSCGDHTSGVQLGAAGDARVGEASVQARGPLQAERAAAAERLLAPVPTIDQYGPYQIELGNGTFAYLQQIATAADASSLLLPGMGGRFVNYSLFVDETQALELFSLYVPDSPANERRPLLAAFHGYGTSHRDIYVRTSFFQEAEQRDWYLIAPLQRSLADPSGNNADIHFSSAQSQLHVQAVLDFVIDHYSVDRDRLYGVGFSMGGGGVMSFAARNRDRRSGALAAVVNHTGSVALGDVYANLPAGSPVFGIMELIFGGPPQDHPFEWLRSSLIEVDDQGMLVPGGLHMALNLASVPTQTWYNASDSQGYLVEQSIQLDTYFQGLSGASHELVRVPASSDPSCQQTQHCWGTLNQAMACDWLGQQTLDASPASGSIVADRDGRWGQFDLIQGQSGAFSGVGYEVDLSGNSMTVLGPKNLGSIGVSLSRLGFQATDPLKLSLVDFESSSTVFVFTDVPSPPQSVIREATTLMEDCSGSSQTDSGWCHDPVAQTLTLTEVEDPDVSWRIDF